MSLYVKKKQRNFMLTISKMISILQKEERIFAQVLTIQYIEKDPISS